MSDTIDADSKVADVVSYVGKKLQNSEYVEELQQFIFDQAIAGKVFLTLTHEDLMQAGLSAFGKRKLLLQLVQELMKRVPTSGTIKKLEDSNLQLRECFQILEENNGLKEYLNTFDEEKYLNKHPFLHSHRLGKNLRSKAADELRELFCSCDTVVLVGVSGCGKSHAIYLNALRNICIYLTPRSWILRDFYLQCKRIRLAYSYLLEQSYREEIQELFFKYVFARYIVLLYLKHECSLSNEYLFFLQSENALNVYDALIYNFLLENDLKFKNTLLVDCFLAVDEAQKYFSSDYDILYQMDVSYEKRISFVRFFSWCSSVLGARVVISGTALRLRDMDRLGSGNRALSEYGIQIIHEYNYFNCTDVTNIVLELLSSDIPEDFLKRIGLLLQGRPRILMNFIEMVVRKKISPEKFLEDYIRIIVENGDSDIWSLYGLWKDLFEGQKKSLKVNLRLKSNEVGLECDIQTCFIKILLDSIRFLNEEEVKDGSWFYLTSSEFDNISTGLCPLVDISESKYCFFEPLSMMSGIHYVVSSPLLRSQCFFHLLGAMLGKGTTEQDRGSYFDLFIAMKVAVDASFRSRLFAMAVDVGKRDARTKWISNWVLPDKNYFKLRCRVSDELFVDSLQADSEDVVLPSNLAGPDVKWWIFLFGLKTTWTKSQVSLEDSSKNEETITPSMCFDWRDKKKMGQPLKKKRKLLNEKCIDIAKSRVENSYGFIRVRIELPLSSFVSNSDHKLTNDIHLNLDWKVFRTLLSEDEARYFEVYFKIK
jgi:hypothetical protein